MEIDDILNLNSSQFCLEKTEGGPQLKKTHKFYAQVQGDIAVMGLPWCDFLVWTSAKKNNIFVQRISFYEKYVSDMLAKMLAFYEKHIYPHFYCFVEM